MPLPEAVASSGPFGRTDASLASSIVKSPMNYEPKPHARHALRGVHADRSEADPAGEALAVGPQERAFDKLVQSELTL